MSAPSDHPENLPETVFDSSDSPLLEFSDADGTLKVCHPEITPGMLLQLMRERVKRYGSPIPDGYVPPPGINLEELLKQVPWPPAA